MTSFPPNLLAALATGGSLLTQPSSTISPLASALSQGAQRQLTFRIKRSAAGYHWLIVGGNGEPMLTSEVMTTKAAVMSSMEVVRSLAMGAIVQDLTI